MLRFFQGQRRLAEVLGDSSEPLVERLRREPLVVKPSSLLWVGVILVPLVSVVAALVAEKFSAGAGDIAFPVTAVLFVGLLSLPRAFLRFGADCLEIGSKKEVVRVPYSALDPTGEPRVKTFNGNDAGLLLSLNPAQVERIERIQHSGTASEIAVSRGRTAGTTALRIVSDTQLELSGAYRVPLTELGALVARLAVESAMHVSSPRVVPETGRHRADSGGWFEFPTTDISLPAVCCECLTPTNERSNFYGSIRWLRFLTLGHFTQETSAPVPHCAKCLDALSRRERRKRAIGAAIGVSLGLFLFGVLSKKGVGRMGSVILAIVFGALGGFVGAWLGGFGRSPVEVRGTLRGHSVRLRFRNAEYARRVELG